MKELWKDIQGYKGLYKVSNLGNIISLNYRRQNIIRNMKYVLSKKGYFRVSLYKNGSDKTFTVHRLVAQAFIDNTENKPEVNHKNSIKIDNYVDNLEWNTTKENVNHSFRSGLRNPLKGSDNGFSRLNELEIMAIRRLRNIDKYDLMTLSKKFNTSMSNISSIVNRKTWNHV